MPKKDASTYPDNWCDISRRIRFGRAQGKCEQCGVPHGALIQRSRRNPFVWRLTDGRTLAPGWHKPIKVVLTVHHIGIAKPDGSPGSPHDKTDCREENLIALCQRCHLIADKDVHIENARKTRQVERLLDLLAQERAGQMTLWGDK